MVEAKSSHTNSKIATLKRQNEAIMPQLVILTSELQKRNLNVTPNNSTYGKKIREETETLQHQHQTQHQHHF